MCYEAKRWNQTIPRARGGKFRWIEQTTRPSPAATHFSYRGGNIEISIQTQLENHTCKKKDKDNYLIFFKKCCIPLSISFIDTGSFFSALETWKFPGRCIVATFWEILISNQQRKGKGRKEGIGGVQRGGGGLQTISITARYLIIKRLVYSALSNPLCTFTSLFDTFFKQNTLALS